MNKISPSNQEVLTAIDKSIVKWKDIINGGMASKIPTSSSCPLCHLNKKYELSSNTFCNFCIISEVTKEPSCDNTPFYDTSLWRSIMDHEEYTPNIADNQMLVFLYEIRRIQVIRMIKAFNYTNSVLTIKMKDFK